MRVKPGFKRQWRLKKKKKNDGIPLANLSTLERKSVHDTQKNVSGEKGSNPHQSSCISWEGPTGQCSSSSLEQKAERPSDFTSMPPARTMADSIGHRRLWSTFKGEKRNTVNLAFQWISNERELGYSLGKRLLTQCKKIAEGCLRWGNQSESVLVHYRLLFFLSSWATRVRFKAQEAAEWPK